MNDFLNNWVAKELVKGLCGEGALEDIMPQTQKPNVGVSMKDIIVDGFELDLRRDAEIDAPEFLYYYQGQLSLLNKIGFVPNEDLDMWNELLNKLYHKNEME